MSGAAPCYRAGCVYLQRSHQGVRKGPAVPAGFTPLGEMQYHAIVPDVITYNAAISACGKGPAAPAGPASIRAVQRHAIVPVVIAFPMVIWLVVVAVVVVLGRPPIGGTSGYCCKVK